MNNQNSKSVKSLLVLASAFVFCMIFFNKFHSLVILDTDDWNYLVFTRGLLPDMNAFNPIKVFPENFMPMVSKISFSLFYGWTHDFVLSLAYGYNIVISCFIAIYVWLVYKLLSKKFDAQYSVLLTGMFLMLHFLIYRNGMALSQYGFYSITVNNYFNYTIPTLLNYIVVFCVIYDKSLVVVNKHNIIKNIAFVAMSYFAIFSNLFSNEVLAIYLGVDLLFDIITKMNAKQIKARDVIADNMIKCIVLLFWIVSLYFEKHGARAGQVASDVPFKESIKNAMQSFFLSDVNKVLFFMCIVFALVCAVLYMIKKKDYTLLKINMIWLLIFAYCILLSAKVNTWYISRADVQLEFMGGMILCVVISLAYVVQKLGESKGRIALFVGCLVSLACVNTPGKTYKDSNIVALTHTNGDFDAGRSVQLDNYIINQVVEASSNEVPTIELKVPFFYTDDNWPLANYGIVRIPRQLYEYGVIDNPVEVVFCADETLNYLWQ